MPNYEWLRAVARSDDLAQGEFAAEAAAALATLADDPRGLVSACQRLVDRHPTVGPLWWACARLLEAADPVDEGRAVQSDLIADQVGLELALDLPDDATLTVVGSASLLDELAARRGDLTVLAVTEDGRRRAYNEDVVDLPHSWLGNAVRSSTIVLVEAWAASGERHLAAPGSLAAAATARVSDAAVWMAVGVGRRLPERLFQAMIERVEAAQPELWQAPTDLVPLELVDRTIEPVKIVCSAPQELL